MRRTFLSLVLVTVFLPGCISLLPSSRDLAPRLALDAGTPMQTAPAGPTISASLAIMDPDAAAVYNTFNVAVATAPFQYEYIANAEWTDRVPVLVRRFLEQRFENEQLFAAVGDRTDFVASDYELYTDIRAFHVDRQRGGNGIAKIAYGARLTDRRGQTLGTRVFAAEVAVSGREREDIVQALNEAATTAADEVVAWVGTLAQ